jgi:anaerobic selenocysteine-containing dehydrogenase
MRVSVGTSEKPIQVLGEKTSPITQGFLCPRGVADIRRTYSNERILFPHRRVGAKPDDVFERISWHDALDILADRLGDALNRSGPESLLHLSYEGNMGLFTTLLPQRLFNTVGFSKTDEAICSKSGHDAISLHYGLSYGVEPDDLPNMKLTVYWGFNAVVSAPHLFSLSLKTRKKDGIIVAIDPRRSETARAADLWIQPRPGSDVALAYGIMKQLIDGKLTDLDFIRRYTNGFDELKQEISRWNPESIEKYTGLNWPIIVKLAESYASCKPSATMIGIGMQKSLHGAESVRAASLIPSLLGLHRGFTLTNGKGWSFDDGYLTGSSLTHKRVRVVSQVALGRHLKKGEFKFIYINNMNPVETLPNHEAVAEGLKRKDLFVVVNDTHWTETARKYADLVLPAPTFLEKEDIVVPYMHRHVRMSRKVIEPLGESRDELSLMTQLVGRLNLREEWLHEDPWKAAEKAMENAFQNGHASELRKGRTLELKMKPKEEYQTATGRIEFYARKADQIGASPLPKQYPLLSNRGFILLNSAISKYTHTQFQDVYGPMPPTVFINPEDAKTYSLNSKDRVELFNELGSIRLRAEVSDSVPKGVLWSPRECRDLNGKPQNTVMSDTTQKLGGGSTFNSTIVKLRKEQEKR